MASPKLVMEEALVKVQDLDPAYWAYWLSAVGYSNTAGAWRAARRSTYGMLRLLESAACHALHQHATENIWNGRLHGCQLQHACTSSASMHACIDEWLLGKGMVVHSHDAIFEV